MKKILCFSVVMMIYFGVSVSRAQLIPAVNGSFEVWDTFGNANNIILPDSWPTTDLLVNTFSLNTSTVRPDTRSHSGQYAAKIRPDTAGNKIWPGIMGCKTALRKRAHSMYFYYIDSLSYINGSQVSVGLFKTKNGVTDSLGGGLWNFPLQYSQNYTYQEIPIDYVNSDSTDLPDTAIINFKVSEKTSGQKPGYVVVDDVGFVIHNSGIDSAAAGADFDIYPNPSSGYIKIINLSENTGYQLLVSDEQGRDIATLSNVINNTQVDLSAYPSGVYFARFTSGHSSAVKKLVLVR